MMHLEYNTAQNTKPETTPISSHRPYGSTISPAQGEKLAGPLDFVEMIEDLHNSPGLIVFGRRDTTVRTGFRHYGGCTLDELRQEQDSVKKLLAVDGIMTINTVFLADGERPSKQTNFFRFCRRRVQDLAWINAAYVDIDCGKVGLNPLKVCHQAFDLMITTGLPLPSHVAFSGTGLWLLWRLLESIRAWPEKSALLRRLNRQLATLFKHFGSDFASIDAARIMRCAGTVNSKNQARVQFFRVQQSTRLPFDELIRIFHVPAEKTWLPGEKKRKPNKNPKRVKAGKLRFGRRLSGFLRLCEIRGKFVQGTRHQAIFGFAVLLFKNGVKGEVITERCLSFGKNMCTPPISNPDEVVRRVNAAFRYREHISDATFCKWFHITPSERIQLTGCWFRPKHDLREPAKVRIAKRRKLVSCERARIPRELSNYKAATILAGVLQDRYGIKVTFMTVKRDLRFIDRAEDERDGSEHFLA